MLIITGGLTVEQGQRQPQLHQGGCVALVSNDAWVSTQTITLPDADIHRHSHISVTVSNNTVLTHGGLGEQSETLLATCAWYYMVPLRLYIVALCCSSSDAQGHLLGDAALTTFVQSDTGAVVVTTTVLKTSVPLPTRFGHKVWPICPVCLSACTLPHIQSIGCHDRTDVNIRPSADGWWVC
jgi:hypothetical protein